MAGAMLAVKQLNARGGLLGRPVELLARDERYSELGGDIVREDTYAGGALDFSDQIARILALPALPDMLYISAGPDDIGRLVKQVREAGSHVPIVGGDGYDTPLLLQVAGAAADNTYFTTHAFLGATHRTPAVAQFIADYQAEYGAPPDTAFAALGYDAVMLIAHAIEAGGLGETERDARGPRSARGLPRRHRVYQLRPAGTPPREGGDSRED
jgi:branched-chain amino acid transport system substrate-binding protein